MRITFVTSNNGKAESLRRVFAPYGMPVEQVSIELPEPQLASLREIAEHKARYAHAQIERPVAVQDSGFFLEAWNGFPGAFVKFALQTLDLDGFLALVTERSRDCAFRECLSFFDGTQMHFFEATISGTLASEPRGSWKPDAPTRLWSIFIPDGCEKTLAEMSDEELAEWRRVRPKNYGDLFAEWYFGPAGPDPRR